MLELTQQDGKLTNVNVRAEKHGDENVTAMDLSIHIKVPNDVLSEFDPKLKASLYQKGDEAQGELVDDKNHLPALKFPKLDPLKWNVKLEDYDFALHYGVGGKSDIELSDCKVDKFVIAPQEGGTVYISFKVSCVPQSAQIGKISDLIADSINFSMSYSEPPAQGDFVQPLDGTK